MQLTITLYPTSNLFMSGLRIRLDVSSSNFPEDPLDPEQRLPRPPGARRFLA